MEARRRLAVERCLDGFAPAEVAEFLGVAAQSVRRWVADFRRRGEKGLSAVPPAGPKLTARRERAVLRWPEASPTRFGFANELWTAPRIARIIREKWGVAFRPRHLNRWLRRRGITPQTPQRVPRERDPEEIAGWLARDWPRIKRGRPAAAPASC